MMSPERDARPRVLACRTFERKKCVQYDLLAVKVDAIRQGKEMGDLLPHLDPLIEAASHAEPAHRRGFGRQYRSLLRTPRRQGNHARKPCRQQLADHAERLLAIIARKPIGKSVERNPVEIGKAVKQIEELAIDCQAARRAEFERTSDAAL